MGFPINKKRIVLFSQLLIFLFLIQFISAAYLECLVKTSDTVLSNSPREAWTEAMFEEEMRGNTKQGYILVCNPEGWNWGSSERDPTRAAIVKINESEFNSSWLEPEYDYSKPNYDCGFADANSCKLTACPDWCGEDINCLNECFNECDLDCNGVISSYEIKTERKYKLPLESFIPQATLNGLKQISCNDTSPRMMINQTINNSLSLIVANNWSLKPFDWVRPGDPSCDFYASMGKWGVEGSSLIGYPRYDGERNKVLKLDNAVNLTSDNVTLEMPEGIMIKSKDLFWDGNIILPTAKENASAIIQDKDSTIKKVIEVGFANAKLVFDRAVKLTIFGEAGALVGFSRLNESFQEISKVCADDSQGTNDLLPEGGECKIDNGKDLVIWTKHFTEFVTYSLDADNDGILDQDDLCFETPEEEEVNLKGCSCSQIEIPLRDCPENQCLEENWNIYPEDGIDTCVAGEIVGEYSCEVISSKYNAECDLDDDNDGVLDEEDLCSNTELPETFKKLILRGYGDVDGDGTFETRRSFLSPVSDSNFNLKYTSGCNCKQILELKPGKNIGENLFGCQKSTLWTFINKVGWAKENEIIS